MEEERQNANVHRSESPESPFTKSKSSTKNNSNCNNSSSSSNNNNKEQDRFLPIANVGRIMKKVIPGNGKISKESKETVQECVSEFISFVTGEASDKCQREKRKTINGDDIIWAITTLGFEDYVSPLKLYLTKYREIEDEKLNIPKQQRSSSTQDQHQLPPNPPYNTSSSNNNNNNNVVYSSSPNPLISQPSFLTPHHDQPFSLSFSSPNSLQKQLQQDHIDSVAHW